MNKFCVGQIVRIILLNDVYYGCLAKVVRHYFDLVKNVYNYEVRFLQDTDCKVGLYPEYALSEVEAPSHYTLDAIKFYAQNKYYNKFSDVVEKKWESMCDLRCVDGRTIKRDAFYGLNPGSNCDSLKKAIEDYWKYDEQIIKDTIRRILMEENNMTGLPRKSGRYPWGDSNNIPKIKKVIFNDPATIVIFEDGTKTIVKVGEGEKYDPEKGLAMALAKRVFGTNKAKSNYYDIFKKWLPKKEKSVEDISDEITDAILNGSSKKEVKKLVKESMDIMDSKKDNNPCNDCSNRKRGCITNCEPFQNYIDSIQEKPKAEPIKPGYFVEHSKERKEKIKISENPTPEKEPLPMPISYFVEKFEASMFPAEFINFCKKNNLYFYIVDQVKGGLKKIDPYHVNWQQVTGYLKKGLMDSCKKVKYHKNSGSTFLAVNMDQSLFQRLPIELREVNRKEEK